MNEEERDIVEFQDEDGNSLLLEVLDSFYYNGEEFAVLGDLEENDEGCEGCGHDHVHGEECEHEHSLYIMKVEMSTDENGEEVEEFTPVEESLMDALIEIVNTRFMEEDDEEGGEIESGE